MSQRPGPDGLIEVRVTAIRYAARDTHLFEFRRADGGVLPAAEAGAHIDVHLGKTMIRQYSLTAAEPSPTRYVIGVKREEKGRGGSRFMHETLRVGTLLKVSPPRNNFPLDGSRSCAILVAGGIGITPILSMARHLAAIGRSWRLYYSCRSRADAAFLEELQALEAVQFNFDDENAGRFLDLAAIAAAAPRDAHLYCCGPLPMLKAFEEATSAWPREQVHVEYFVLKDVVAVEGGFVVALARSGIEIAVPPGKSILEALREEGVPVVSSCEIGICGTCETRVVSGIPDHHDSILTEAERGAGKTMMICCSGAKSDRLVLDL